MEKEPLIKMSQEKRQAIENICRGLFNFWIITCVFIFFLLGALQEKYQFENTLVKDVNVTLGMAGATTVNVFLKEGASRPNFWIIFFPIALILNFYINVISIVIDEKKNLHSSRKAIYKGGLTNDKSNL